MTKASSIQGKVAAPTLAGQLDLSNLPLGELVELHARAFRLIRAELQHRSEIYKRYIGKTFNVLWYPDKSYFPAKLLAVHEDSGLLEVEWLEIDEGYSKRCLVSPDCIGTPADSTNAGS